MSYKPVQGSQTTFTRQGRQMVQKCPLFVNVYAIENVNAGGQVIKRSQNFVNIVSTMLRQSRQRVLRAYSPNIYSVIVVVLCISHWQEIPRRTLSIPKLSGRRPLIAPIAGQIEWTCSTQVQYFYKIVDSMNYNVDSQCCHKKRPLEKTPVSLQIMRSLYIGHFNSLSIGLRFELAPENYGEYFQFS